MISIACPKCGRFLTVKDEAAGKKACCPQCHNVVPVMGAAGAVSSAASEAETLLPNSRVSAEEPIHARPAGPAERLAKWVRRRPAMAAMYSLALLVILLGGVGGPAWLWLSAEKAHREAEGTRQELAAAQQQLEQVLYLQKVARAHQEWREIQVGRAEKLLRDCPLPLRNWEWHYVNHLCHSDLLTLTGHTRAVISVVWDPATGQHALTLKGHTGRVYSVAFSPDSQRLASGSFDQTVKVWDAATGQDALTLKGHTGAVRGVAFSPDGKRLASASFDQTVKLWDAVASQE